MISSITASSSEPVASPRPTIEPTVVIDVEAGTPPTLDSSNAKPIKKSTAILTSSV